MHELEFEESADEVNLENKAMFPNSIFSHVSIDKTETHIYIKANVGSKAHFSCDRCLKEFEQEISGDFKLYYEVISHGSHAHLVEEKNSSQDDTVRIFRADHKQIDLTSDIREIILLTIPMKIVCSQDCKGICPGCGKDLNQEQCVCSKQPIDPRWEGLQKLLDKECKK